jgi:hypothetical protein
LPWRQPGGAGGSPSPLAASRPPGRVPTAHAGSTSRRRQGGCERGHHQDGGAPWHFGALLSGHQRLETQTQRMRHRQNVAGKKVGHGNGLLHSREASDSLPLGPLLQELRPQETSDDCAPGL